MKTSLFCVLLMGFSTITYAANTGTPQGPGMMSNIFLLGGFLLIFYFMLIRPQSKRAKEHQTLVNNIAKEDEVILNSGMLGKVSKVTDQFLVVNIAEGVEVKVQKQAVTASVPKGTMKNI